MTNCTVTSNEASVKNVQVDGKACLTNGVPKPVQDSSGETKSADKDNQQPVAFLKQVSGNGLSTSSDAVSKCSSKSKLKGKDTLNSIVNSPSTNNQLIIMPNRSIGTEIPVVKTMPSASNSTNIGTRQSVGTNGDDESSLGDDISIMNPFSNKGGNQTTVASLRNGQVSVNASSPKVSAQYLHTVSTTTLSDLFSLMNQHAQDNRETPVNSDTKTSRASELPATSSKPASSAQSPLRRNKKPAKHLSRDGCDETCTENGNSRPSVVRYSLRSSVLDRIKKVSRSSPSSKGTSSASTSNKNGSRISTPVVEAPKQELHSAESINEDLALIPRALEIKHEYDTLDVPMTKQEIHSLLGPQLGTVNVVEEVSCTSESSDCDELTAIYTKKSAPSHFCMSCAKEFGRRSVYLKHICVKCVYCGIRVPQKEDMLRHLVVHETGQRPFVCTACGKQFHHRKAYQDHQRKHSIDGRFCCSICSKSFKVRSFLTRHELKHMGVRPQSCKFCQKMFVTKWQLREHKERVHGGRTLHNCTLCNQTFSKLDRMRRHLFQHTGEKPFHCLWCNKSFMKKHSLQKHQSQHRDNIAASLRLASHQRVKPVSYSAHLSASVKANLRLKKKQEKS